MIEKLRNLRKTYGEKLLYEDMRVCFYCKHWGIVNWCNLKNKKRYPSSSCEKWEVSE